MEHKIHKIKSLTIDSIMKNPDLYQKLKVGLESELGSSKREEALSILKSVKRVNSNKFFGQGGGEMTPINTFKDYFKTSGTPSLTTTPTPQTPGTPAMTSFTPKTGGEQMPGGVFTPTTSNASNTPTTAIPGTTPESGKVPVKDPFSQLVSGYTDLLNNPPVDFNTYYSNLSKEEQERLKDFKEAIDKNYGGSMFTQSILSDPEKFNRLFPGVPESERPTGASLLGQLNDLESTLNEEMKIKEQENKLLELQKNGANLQSDLNAYIMSKDKNIKSIDELINKTTDALPTLDLADPHNKQMYDNYMNYLYTLKGRQQERYNTYIDRSIKEYDATISNLNNKLTSDKNNFINEFNIRSGILTNDYQNRYKAFSDSLMGMYDDAINMQTNEANKYKLKGDLLNNTFSMIDGINKLTGSTTKDSDLVRNGSKYNDFITSYTEAVPYPDDSTKKLNLIKGDIDQLINKATEETINETTGEKLRGDSIIKLINERIINDAGIAIDQKLLNKYWNNYAPMIKSYFDRWSQNPEEISPVDVNNAYQLANNLISSIKSKISGELSDDAKLKTYSDAIGDLLGLGGNFLFRNKEKLTNNSEKIKWINAHKGIDPLILEAIHTDLYNAYKKVGGNISTLISEEQRTTPSGISNLINDGLWQINNMDDIGFANKILEAKQIQ